MWHDILNVNIRGEDKIYHTIEIMRRKNMTKNKKVKYDTGHLHWQVAAALWNPVWLLIKIRNMTHPENHCCSWKKSLCSYVLTFWCNLLPKRNNKLILQFDNKSFILNIRNMGVLQKTSLYYNISKLLMNYYVKSIFISSISKEP